LEGGQSHQGREGREKRKNRIRWEGKFRTGGRKTIRTWKKEKLYLKNQKKKEEGRRGGESRKKGRDIIRVGK